MTRIVEKLKDEFGEFTIDNIQQEISFQNGGNWIFLILKKKGNPIRDFPNTRGKLYIT